MSPSYIAAGMKANPLQLVVKNTFLEVVESPMNATRLIRSQSEKSFRIASFECDSTDCGAASSSSDIGTDDDLSVNSMPTGSSEHELVDLESPVVGRGLQEELVHRSDLAKGASLPANSEGGRFEYGTLEQSTSLSNMEPPATVVSLHASGTCKPCFSVHTRMGCRDGKNCKFCHEPDHDARQRYRPSKSVRDLCKRAARMLESGDPEAAGIAQDLLARHGSYMIAVLRVTNNLPATASMEEASPTPSTIGSFPGRNCLSTTPQTPVVARGGNVSSKPYRFSAAVSHLPRY